MKVYVVLKTNMDMGITYHTIDKIFKDKDKALCYIENVNKLMPFDRQEKCKNCNYKHVRFNSNENTPDCYDEYVFKSDNKMTICINEVWGLYPLELQEYEITE